MSLTYEFKQGERTAHEMSFEIDIEDKDHPYNRIPYLCPSEVDREDHFIVRDDDRIIAMGGVQINPYNPSELWGKFIGVDVDYRRQGIGVTLLSKMIDYARENGFTFVPSSYTDQGEQYLKPAADKILSERF